MSREIKFRAWDKHLSRFNFIIGSYDLRYWSADASLGPNQPISAMPWEQFTGLQDKNGKDIFEGDIVDCAGHYTGIVVWNNECASFALKTAGDSVSDHLFGATLTEVVGNIHENPELLESQS